MVLTEAQIFKEVCENDFAFYVKHYLKIVEPETQFEWNWHMDTLCHYCERVFYGDIKALDINIPPRSLKSLIVTVLFPTWVWTKVPSSKFIVSSRSFDLANKFNNQRRDLIQHEAYKVLWPVIIREDKNRTDIFQNYDNGFMKAASVGGKITGEGADFLISDDLLDAMDAFSDAKRKHANNWFSKVFSTRYQNKKKVRRININQRLHKSDISGEIQKNNKNFQTLILPMKMTKTNLSTCDFVDPRAPGEFLFPSRYGEEEEKEDKLALGSSQYSSQFQQMPTPEEGGIIKREHIKYYTTPPESFDRTITTADLRFKEKDKENSGDYVSYMKWGLVGVRKYLLKVTRGKWGYKESKDKFISFCKDGETPEKYIENKANGPALVSDLSPTSDRDGVTGLKLWPEKGSEYMNLDKVQRLKLCEADFENGEVFLPANDEMTPILVEELLSFTDQGSSADHDDLVDTTTMALIEFKKPQTFFF